MKKLISILVLLTTLLSTASVYADESTRPSISISIPCSRIVESGTDVRYTISLSSPHGEELCFNTAKIETDFNYTYLDIIKISSNTYDVVFRNVTGSGTGRIHCLKGTGTIIEGKLETIETPKSASFYIYNKQTTRKEIADYLLRVLLNNETLADYNLLKSSGLMIGNENGDLNLGNILSLNEAYILNRRLELINE